VIEKRYFYAANALVGFLFLGLIYAWSVFVGPLEAHFGWVRSQTSLNFSICMATYSFGGLLGAKLSKARPPTQVMILAAAFILVGFILTSRIESLIQLYIFHGVLCGLGVGIGYNTLLSVTLQWFPERQGMMSGILLMGFGFGGSLLGGIAVFMMNLVGWRYTFAVLGIILASLLVLIALNVKKPSFNQAARNGLESKNEKNFETREMLRDGSFYAFYARSVLATAVGLAMLGNAAPFALSIADNPVTATVIAGLISILNGLGRVAGGFIFDRTGSRFTILMSLSGMFLASGVLILAALSGSVAFLTLGYILGGFFYGTNIPCSSGFISRVYGPRNFAANFSILNTYVLFSSFVGPYAFGVVFTLTGSYTASCVALLIMVCASFAATALIKRHYIPSNSPLMPRYLKLK
jgi:OFA family oxalate/formate antiporter-like MFS transporter